MSSEQSGFQPSIRNLSDYLQCRNEIIAARDGFFHALRAYLSPDARPDAKELADGLWDSEARKISEADWVANPSRGYLTIKESPAHGRPFRISVLQMGHILRVGVRLPPAIAAMKVATTDRIASTYHDKAPTRYLLSSGEALFDWTFQVPDLYESALTMESAVFLVGSLFENSLQACLAKK